MRNTNVTTTVIIVIIIILIIIGLIYWAQNPNTSVNPTQSATSTEFTLMSPVFTEGARIPTLYTCEGQNINPPLSFNNVPAGTQSLVLTMYDPDVPKQVRSEGFFDHWNLFNIPAGATGIPASSTAGVSGNNGRNIAAYTGPCPPTEYEPKEHRYIFTLYALDTQLALSAGATRSQIEEAVKDHVLDKAELTGKYEKMSTTTQATSTNSTSTPR
jgi:Raf kinase inhibitor-like YbhB/YbcL family protein